MFLPFLVVFLLALAERFQSDNVLESSIVNDFMLTASGLVKFKYKYVRICRIDVRN